MHVAYVSQPWSEFHPPKPNPYGDSIGIWTESAAARVSAFADVSILARRFRDDQAANETHGRVRYHRFRTGRFAFGARSIVNLSWRGLTEVPDFFSYSYSRSYARRVGQYCRDQSVDIAHVHNFAQFAPTIRVRSPATRILLHMSSDWLNLFDGQETLSYLQPVKMIVGVSDHITEQIRRRFRGVTCRTIPDAVDTDRFAPVSGAEKPPEAPIDLVFAGRISPEKGVHTLIEAFNRVGRDYPNARLTVSGSYGTVPRNALIDVSPDPLIRDLARFYGTGVPYGEQCQRLVDPGVRERVSFRRALPHDELADHLAQADIAVVPSLWEPFGSAATEAMACGRPVVAARAGSNPETVTDGETGVLVPPGDAAALADALTALVADPSRRASLGLAGRKRAVERFSWNVVIGQWRNAYQELMDGPP